MDMSDVTSAGSDPDVSPEFHDGRQAYVEPKLTYVTPKLIKRGDVSKVTAGFLGSFSP
jgi:hypothetical protein